MHRARCIGRDGSRWLVRSLHLLATFELSDPLLMTHGYWRSTWRRCRRSKALIEAEDEGTESSVVSSVLLKIAYAAYQVQIKAMI